MAPSPGRLENYHEAKTQSPKREINEEPLVQVLVGIPIQESDGANSRSLAKSHLAPDHPKSRSRGAALTRFLRDCGQATSHQSQADYLESGKTAHFA